MSIFLFHNNSNPYAVMVSFSVGKHLFCSQEALVAYLQLKAEAM